MSNEISQNEVRSCSNFSSGISVAQAKPKCTNENRTGGSVKVSSVFEKANELISKAQKITIIQAENPDGDSLGSALALEEILSDINKEVQLFCPVDIPKYLRYFSGWDRVSDNLWPSDLFVIVDTASQILLSKIWENPLYRNMFEKTPILVIDHHTDATPDLLFEHEIILLEKSSCAEVILDLAENSDWKINSQAAEHLMGAILSDTLGFSTQNVNFETFEAASKLAKLGASTSKIEESRREFSKKAPEILDYKGDLIKRIEYFLDGKLAIVHIPWDEIKKYSDKYNPSVLVIDEMRMVEGVEVCVAVKTYPGGKLTGKIRTNSPVASDIAGFFGGGGHAYAAGFRIYDETYDTILNEILTATERALR